MDAALAVALIMAGLALGIAIGALILATRSGGGASGGSASEELHRKYSAELTGWLKNELLVELGKIKSAVKTKHPEIQWDPGITDPPKSPGGGD